MVINIYSHNSSSELNKFYVLTPSIKIFRFKYFKVIDTFILSRKRYIMNFLINKFRNKIYHCLANKSPSIIYKTTMKRMKNLCHLLYNYSDYSTECRYFLYSFIFIPYPIDVIRWTCA